MKLWLLGMGIGILLLGMGIGFLVVTEEPSPQGQVHQAFEPELASIPKGCFQMGRTAGEEHGVKEGNDFNDERQHRVCVETFQMAKTEVTQGQWRVVMGNNPSYFNDCGDDCPVETVSWYDVYEYINKLNTLTGGWYRLPTEAEWEYACRGGVPGELYCGGNNLDILAWHDGNSGKKTHPVHGKRPNGYGLYDMTGNVFEWTCSGYDAGYSGAEGACKRCGFTTMVSRGGGTRGKLLRAAARFDLSYNSRLMILGFRLVRTDVPLLEYTPTSLENCSYQAYFLLLLQHYLVKMGFTNIKRLIR